MLAGLHLLHKISVACSVRDEHLLRTLWVFGSGVAMLNLYLCEQEQESSFDGLLVHHSSEKLS